jgi:hypothetical protein
MIQGPLPLILLAAEDHPSEIIRERLWSQLEKWLANKNPPLNSTEIDDLFDAETGTALEPFRLSGNDARLANYLVRLALVPRSPVSRFRVTGEDTIGNEGGIVITQSGKSYYSERFALGNNRPNNSNLQFFAPNMKVALPILNSTGPAPHANMRATDDGVFIEIGEDCLSQLGWVDESNSSSFHALAKKLKAEIAIGEAGVPLAEVGLSVQAGEGSLIIGSGSPESLIRLSAYIVQGSQIVLKGMGHYELILHLPKTGSGEASCTVFANDGFARGWMNVGGFGAPTLNDRDVSEVVNWALPHESWINQIKERKYDTK